MVRLKGDIFEIGVTALPAFQFLMVRLKAICVSKYFAPEPFQFLMVRLKVHKNVHIVSCNRISIPYGAIKRK